MLGICYSQVQFAIFRRKLNWHKNGQSWVIYIVCKLAKTLKHGLNKNIGNRFYLLYSDQRNFVPYLEQVYLLRVFESYHQVISSVISRHICPTSHIMWFPVYAGRAICSSVIVLIRWKNFVTGSNGPGNAVTLNSFCDSLRLFSAVVRWSV